MSTPGETEFVNVEQPKDGPEATTLQSQEGLTIEAVYGQPGDAGVASLHCPDIGSVLCLSYKESLTVDDITSPQASERIMAMSNDEIESLIDSNNKMAARLSSWMSMATKKLEQAARSA